MTRDQFISQNPIDQVLESKGVKLIGGGDQRTARCPFHNDSNPSFSVNVKKGVWRCITGCGQGSVIDLLAMYEGITAVQYMKKNLIGEARNSLFSGGKKMVFQKKEKREERRDPPPPENAKRKIVATYTYHDEIGQEVYQSVRYEPKHFKQRRKDGDDWIWGMEGVKRVLYHLPQVLKSKSVWICFAPNTELLTPNGWVGISNIGKHAKIAQFIPETGRIEFVNPLKTGYLDFCGEMLNFKGRASDVMVTPDHSMIARKPIRNGIGPVERFKASEIKPHWFLPFSGILSGGKDSGMLDPQIRLLASIQADGSFPRGFHLEWNLKKERKKERLRGLLSLCGIKFLEKTYRSAPGWTHFIVEDRRQIGFLKHLPDKHFSWDMLQWDVSSRESLLSELQFWDGDSVGPRGSRFFTSSYEDAQIISAMGPVSGYSTTIRSVHRPERKNCKIEFVVSLTKSDWRTTKAFKRVKYSGSVYCVTVPSHAVLTRRNGKVTITGQCEGEKDADNLCKLGYCATTNVAGAQSWLDAYSLSLKGKDVVICGDNDEAGKDYVQKVFQSLTGKASSVRMLTLPEEYKDVSDYIETFEKPEEAKAALDEIHYNSHVFYKGHRIMLKTMATMEQSYIRYVKDKTNVSFNLANWMPSFKTVRPLVPGEMVLIIGATGVGKTALASNIAIKALPLPTLLFELELPDDPLFERFAAAKHKLKTEEVEQEYESENYIGAEGLDSLFPNLCICSESGLTLRQIEEQIIYSELFLGHRPILVIIDYIQLMQGKGNRRERIADAVEGLKQVAKRRKVIIVLISQTQRPDEDGDPEITLYSGKESGSLENSAGLVIGIWRDRKIETLMHGRILKNTRGRSGMRFKMDFDGERMLYSEHPIMSGEDIPDRKHRKSD